MTEVHLSLSAQNTHTDIHVALTEDELALVTRLAGLFSEVADYAWSSKPTLRIEDLATCAEHDCEVYRKERTGVGR